MPRPHDARADDPEASAEEAGLRYVSDAVPGVRRRRAGKGFTYIDVRRQPHRRSERRIDWIRGLAIPPAWTDVWISPDPARRTSRPPAATRAAASSTATTRAGATVRDEAKYGRLIDFARALPRIRRRTDRDLRRRGLPREKVLALVVRLLEATLIRVGNEEYARENRSYGLSTMRDRHVEVRGGDDALHVPRQGRQGARDRRARRAPRAARPTGARTFRARSLFQYRDARRARARSHLRRRQRLPARDQRGRSSPPRTSAPGPAPSPRRWPSQEFTRDRRRGGAQDGDRAGHRAVAEQLGNTPSVCRACYVHPEVLDATSTAPSSMPSPARARRRPRRPRPSGGEAAVLGLLQARLARERTSRRAA